MSYTTFEYSKPVVSAQTMNTDGSIDVSVKVKNTGKVAGKEIIQLYIGDEECSVLRPVKELKDFGRYNFFRMKKRGEVYNQTGSIAIL